MSPTEAEKLAKLKKELKKAFKKFQKCDERPTKAYRIDEKKLRDRVTI